MRKYIIIGIIASSIAIMLFGCGKKGPDDKVLARIGDRTITLKYVKDRVAKLPPHFQELVNKDKEKFLEDVIIDELFYEEAVRKGVQNDAETRDIIAEAKKKILIAKLVKNEVEDKVVVTDEMLQEYYQENKDQFKSPMQWRASHILVKTEEEARAILDELKAGADFAEVATRRSLDPTASRGGDIGYFAKGHVVPVFEDACIKLEVGQISDVVKTQFGYHIIKLTDIKEQKTEDFETVKRFAQDVVTKNMRKELFNNLITRLKRSYRVEISDDIGEIFGQEPPSSEENAGATNE